jgi:hypothetical protein
MVNRDDRRVDMRPYWVTQLVHDGRVIDVHPCDDGGQVQVDANGAVIGRYYNLPIPRG